MLKVKIIVLLLGLLLLNGCKPVKYADLENGLYANLETNKGVILLKLNFEKTPITVANFVSLANGTNQIVTDSLKGKPFYNSLVFHRVIHDFMIQGGDPTGTGEGGPGYSFIDEFPKDNNGRLLLKHDKAGTLSMANSGQNTNGSQFFITHKETPWLDGKHTVFGYVVKGLNVVDSIQQYDTIKKVDIVAVGTTAKRFNAQKIFSDYYYKYQEAVKEHQKKIQTTENATKLKIEENSSKAKQLSSGLKIFIEETKNGEKPKNGNKVSVFYAGYFPSGQLFDTNYKNIAKDYLVYDEAKDSRQGYEAFTTIYGPQAMLISGFSEGLQNMRVGDKAMLFIPAHLGYGIQGVPGVIPPNTDLVFEVEIVELIK